MTVVSHRRWAGDAAERVVVQKRIHVVGHEKIEVAVAIDVEKGTTGTPHIGIGAAGIRHFGKPAATGVVIQLIRTDVGDVQVNQAVIVIVAGAGAHPVPALPDTRRGRRILERPIAAIPVQAMARAPCDGCIGDGTAVHQEDVEPAIIVKVEEKTARPQNLGQEPLVACAVDVDEVQPDRTSDIAEDRKPHRRAV